MLLCFGLAVFKNGIPLGSVAIDNIFRRYTLLDFFEVKPQLTKQLISFVDITQLEQLLST